MSATPAPNQWEMNRRPWKTLWRTSSAVGGSAIGIVVGYTTNLVTGDSPSVAVLVGFATAVAATLAISGGQAIAFARTERRQDREHRSTLLLPLTPTPSPNGPHTIATLLDPLSALLPFAGRGTEVHELLTWCTEPEPLRVRILEGPVGVGKTRLAAEMASRLPDGWVAGRVRRGGCRNVLDAVMACGDPTLVVVDNADSQPDVAELIDQLPSAPDGPPVRILLTVRDEKAFSRWLNSHLDQQQNFRHTTLGAFGADSDRRRWFIAATTQFSRLLGLRPNTAGPIPDLGPVGFDGEPILITHLRAALAAAGAATTAEINEVRRLGSTELALLLLRHEEKRWDRVAADPHWSVSAIAPTVRRRALLGLFVSAPTDEEEAVAQLMKLRLWPPNSEAQPRALLEWASYLYPRAEAGHPVVDPRPGILAAATIAAIGRPEYETLLQHIDIAEAAARNDQVLLRCARAATLFPDAFRIVEQIVHTNPSLGIRALDAVALAGVDWTLAEPAILRAIETFRPDNHQLRRVASATADDQWLQVRFSVLRSLSEQDRQVVGNAAHQATLAQTLVRYGTAAEELGDFSTALSAFDEATDLLVGLSTAPEELADCLRRKGVCRRLAGLPDPLGPIDQAIALLTSETVVLGRCLTAASEILTLHHIDIARAVEASRRAVELFSREPQSRTDLSRALSSLSIALNIIGEPSEALMRGREAVAIIGDPPLENPHLSWLRDRAEADWAHGHVAWRVDALVESLASRRHATRVHRRLAELAPQRYQVKLADALHTQGDSERDTGNLDRAIRLQRESAEILRELHARQSGYATELADCLHCLARTLLNANQTGEALAVTQEGVQVAERQNLAIQMKLQVRLGEVVMATGDLDEASRILHRIRADVVARRTIQEHVERTAFLLSLLLELARHRNDAAAALQLTAEHSALMATAARNHPSEYTSRHATARSALATLAASVGLPPQATLMEEEAARRRLNLP